MNLFDGLLFSLAIALPITLFAPSFIGLFTDDARLCPLAMEYLPVAAFIGVAFAIQNSYTVFLQLSGRASLVVRITIVQMVVNLLLDLLFIIVCAEDIMYDIDYNYRNGVNCVVMKFYK